jgi:lipopolysaccharide biosynthesis protein
MISKNETLMSASISQQAEQLRRSGFFDEQWYIRTYPDVAILGIDPIEHYLWLGSRLGRDPSPNFSSRGYLAAHPDVAAAGVNPLVHYALTGQYEQRGGHLTSAAPALNDARPIYQPRLSYDAPTNPLARVIAFHLPQFHPFAENNEWWGEGFTEWTNVKPTRPHFPGHYQPHVPHEDIGYYDLLDHSSQKKQIELAKSYGIEGFCFYYYWFDGKRLMEKPIENYLSNPDLDHPFCLCWANENWSRRWDGLESEVLIAQNHGPEDDLACIADLARYIVDPRYIRIQRKPLVLIYRPSLLPDPASTARRWRNWCRENGIGEIFLAYTQSFEKVDPAIYGFDAAIEFPPNNSSPPDLTDRIAPHSDNYVGRVYDWRVLVERSARYDTPSYPLFRSVCPGWDNTARRKERGITFVGNTPELYRHWLENAVSDTARRLPDPDERLVFVNAWNEWAEGAHLEPDQLNGYAYLEATRAAIQPSSAASKTALVIHAFYPEVLVDILAYAEQLPGDLRLFVSTVPEKEHDIRDILARQPRAFRLFVNENRGRDVLPFLRMLPTLVDDGVEFFAKVHTKRSTHRDDGAQWRDELYRAVIGRETFHRSLSALESDDRLGMLGPQGHLVSMDTYLGSNLGRIDKYARRLGVDANRTLEYSFFAGTMFIARVSALATLLDLGITEDDFEPEAGQIDGTLAHVIERILAICVQANGYRMAFTSEPNAEPDVNMRYGFA